MARENPLLERDPELDRVLAALGRSAAGEPSLVVVEAAAGLGKTALLQEVRRRSATGVTLLAARPAEHEAAFAYGVLRQLLGAPLAALDPAPRERLVRGSGAAALSALADDAGPPPPFDGSFGIVDGLYWLVAELAARTPLVLLLDDAHWADAPSLHELGTIEEMLSDEACWEHLRSAVAIAPDEATRAAWTLELAVGKAFRGEVPEAVAAVEAAFDARDVPADVRERLGAHLCAFAWGSAEGSPRADALLRRYETDPRRDPQSARLVLSSRAARMDRPADAVVELAETALASDGLLTGVWLGSLLAMGSLVYADRFGAAGAQLEPALDLARATGNQSAIGTAHAMLADLSHATGDLVRCETHARLHLGPLRGRSPASLAYTASILIRALVDRGELDEAEAVLDELGGLPAVPTSHVHYFLRVARGRLRHAQGRFHDAVVDLAAARSCLVRFTGTTWSPIGFDGADAEPLALERLDRGNEARALVAASLPAARSDGPPRNLAATLRTAGMLERGPGGVALVEEAVAVLEGTGARLELARTLVSLGTLRLRAGRRADARARSPAGTTWPTTAERSRWCGARGRSWLPRAPGRDETGWRRAARRSPRASCGWPIWPRTAAPTARSPRSSTSPRRRSRCTSAGRTRSWGSPAGRSWARRWTGRVGDESTPLRPARRRPPAAGVSSRIVAAMPSRSRRPRTCRRSAARRASRTSAGPSRT